MIIAEIYTQYQIMPSLQLHMLRVSSVATLICEEMKIKVDKKNIITACLLHDMGNILKFNLDLFPDFLQPEGKEYWQELKDEFKKKYGNDEHEATLQIAHEIGVEKRTIELIDSFRFSAADENYNSDDFEKKICVYADMRVEPYKVVSLDERLVDGRNRFKLNKKHLAEDEDFFNEMANYLKQIEKQIFTFTQLTPEDITDESVKKYISELRNFEVIVNKK